MPTYTLKVVNIKVDGSIGRELHATFLTLFRRLEFGFTGSSTKHHIFQPEEIFFESDLTLTTQIDVSEIDAKTSDTPFSETKELSIELKNLGKTGAADFSVAISEKGGAGRNKGKKATVTFSIEAEINFSLRDIPTIMTANGWNKGAAILTRWFSAPAGRQSLPDTTTIKMEWVLSFARAKNVYDKIIAEKIYANPAATKLIQKKYGATVGAFGNFKQPVQKLHDDQIQYQYVESSKLDPIDDLFCALGDFALYVAIKGTASTSEIRITHIAIYVRDDFEFGGPQALGFWNPLAKKAAKTPGAGYYLASNAAFRAYAKKNNSGDDFFIFSDVNEIKLDKPVVIPK